MIGISALRALVLALALTFLLIPSMAGASSKRIAELQQIQRLRQTTWSWQKVMGIVPTPTSHSENRIRNSAYRRWVLRLWQYRAASVRRRAAHVPHKAQWLCIHRGEGSWNAHTGNGYYGGLQMDLTFQRTYGGFLLHRNGTADRWSPYEQMWIAERAFRSGRGFRPWPNTARACGLL
ncbi:MAG: transglycosylase family protein [Gaiellaceae bacterium]